MINMILELIAEVTYRTGYWPSSGITKRTNCISFDLLCYVYKQVDIFHVTMAMLDTMQHFFHPSGSFPARTTLSA